jgi:hypothetical protein
VRVASTSAEASGVVIAAACWAFGSIASMNTFIIAGGCEVFGVPMAGNWRNALR